MSEIGDRVEKICTDFTDSEKEKELVTKALQNNGYPRRLVVKNWHPQPHPQLPEQGPPAATVPLPYIRHLSETIRRILVPLGGSHFLPASLHTLTDVGEVEGPHAPTATSWHGLPHPVWFVSQSVHWPNGQDYGTPLEGAQEGIDIREHGPVSDSRACS